jgi:hypothetical protein
MMVLFFAKKYVWTEFCEEITNRCIMVLEWGKHTYIYMHMMQMRGTQHTYIEWSA